MKTLDEVIRKIEACIEADGHCPACPYEVSESCGDMDADALYYLKEYQTLQFSYIKAMADLEDNPPLTWDELKTMEGKSVWLESKRYGARWYLLENVSDNCLVCIGIYGERAPYYRDDDDWQAYRKERK